MMNVGQSDGCCFRTEEKYVISYDEIIVREESKSSTSRRRFRSICCLTSTESFTACSLHLRKSTQTDNKSLHVGGHNSQKIVTEHLVCT